MATIKYSSTYSLAFNQGSDARIRGVPLESNPYHPVTQEDAFKGWRSGWVHCTTTWGYDAMREFSPLPSLS